jgi:hypothetical protein
MIIRLRSLSLLVLEPIKHSKIVSTGASRYSEPVTDRCIEVFETRGELAGAGSSGIIAPGCLELTTPLRTNRVWPSPVWSELEWWPGSKWLELGVQGLSRRVVWRTHQVRPFPVRSELERWPGSECLELGVHRLSHRVVWLTHRVRSSPVRSKPEWRPRSGVIAPGCLTNTPGATFPRSIRAWLDLVWRRVGP